MLSGPILAKTSSSGRLGRVDSKIWVNLVFKISRHRYSVTQLDLGTLRETLHYMKDDADRVPGLEDLSQALATTIFEIERAERKLKPKELKPISAKFLPRIGAQAR